MRTRGGLGGWLAGLVGLAVLWPPAGWAATETTELVTYFPSDMAEVQDLRARRAAAGDDTYWGALAAPDPRTGQPPAAGTLLIQGPVGIGTTTPDMALSIVGSSRAPARDGAAGMGVVSIGGASGAGDVQIRMGYVTGDHSWIQSYAGRPLYINELGNNVILNAGGGRVGIGTTAPASELTVSGPTSAVPLTGSVVLEARGDHAGLFSDGTWTNFFGQLEVANRTQTKGNVAYLSFSGWAAPGASTAVIGSVIQNHTNAGGDLFFWTRNQADGTFGTRLYITGAGNVGIGTLAPQARVQVETDPAQPVGLLARDVQGLPVAAGATRVALQGETRDAAGAANVVGALGWRARLPNLVPRRAAVYGAAPAKTPPNGREPETYAGYFQGDVKIHGNLEVTGRHGGIAWLSSGPALLYHQQGSGRWVTVFHPEFRQHPNGAAILKARCADGYVWIRPEGDARWDQGPETLVVGVSDNHRDAGMMLIPLEVDANGRVRGIDVWTTNGPETFVYLYGFID